MIYHINMSWKIGPGIFPTIDWVLRKEICSRKFSFTTTCQLSRTVLSILSTLFSESRVFNSETVLFRHSVKPETHWGPGNNNLPTKSAINSLPQCSLLQSGVYFNEMLNNEWNRMQKRKHKLIIFEI